MVKPLPLAVALVSVCGLDTPAQRSRRRVAAGVFAHREGYALLETFEISERSIHDEHAIASLIGLAQRVQPRTLIVGDDVSVSWVARVRDVVPMGLLVMPAQAGLTRAEAARPISGAGRTETASRTAIFRGWGRSGE